MSRIARNEASIANMASFIKSALPESKSGEHQKMIFAKVLLLLDSLIQKKYTKCKYDRAGQ